MRRPEPYITIAIPDAGPDPAMCTALPILCADVRDCPLYRPEPEHDWSCTEGVCRFPGFHYAIE